MFPGWRYFTNAGYSQLFTMHISIVFLHRMYFFYALTYHFPFVNYECKFTLISSSKIKINNVPYNLYKYLYKHIFNLQSI